MSISYTTESTAVLRSARLSSCGLRWMLPCCSGFPGSFSWLLAFRLLVQRERSPLKQAHWIWKNGFMAGMHAHTMPIFSSTTLEANINRMCAFDVGYAEDSSHHQVTDRDDLRPNGGLIPLGAVDVGLLDALEGDDSEHAGHAGASSRISNMS